MLKEIPKGLELRSQAENAYRRETVEGRTGAIGLFWRELDDLLLRLQEENANLRNGETAKALQLCEARANKFESAWRDETRDHEETQMLLSREKDARRRTQEWLGVRMVDEPAPWEAPFDMGAPASLGVPPNNAEPPGDAGDDWTEPWFKTLIRTLIVLACTWAVFELIGMVGRTLLPGGK